MTSSGFARRRSGKWMNSRAGAMHTQHPPLIPACMHIIFCIPYYYFHLLSSSAHLPYAHVFRKRRWLFFFSTFDFLVSPLSIPLRSSQSSADLQQLYREESCHSFARIKNPTKAGTSAPQIPGSAAQAGERSRREVRVHRSPRRRAVQDRAAQGKERAFGAREGAHALE